MKPIITITAFLLCIQSGLFAQKISCRKKAETFDIKVKAISLCISCEHVNLNLKELGDADWERFRGAKLGFEMSAEPNKSRGISQGAKPFSLSLKN